MKPPLLVFILLQAMDFATTLMALALGGAENNPLVASFMALGPIRGLLVSKALVIALAVAATTLHRYRGIWCANAVFSGIVLWNVSIITRLAFNV